MGNVLDKVRMSKKAEWRGEYGCAVCSYAGNWSIGICTRCEGIDGFVPLRCAVLDDEEAV